MLQAYQNINHSNKKIEQVLKSFFLLHPKNVDLSLSRIIRLLAKLKDPHKKIKNIIHIAGTNGKGSIATILYNLQKQQGKKVNIYRSPHLISFNERIFIKNKIISNKYLLDILEFVKNVNDKEPITFFEIITAAVFYIFYENKADLTILEVGLGGRYDATNVISKSLVSIISTIDIDHKEFLGDNIKAIANEKAGIIKNKSLVICSKQRTAAKSIIMKKALSMSSKFYVFKENWQVKGNIFHYNDFRINLNKLSLLGDHQYINASCALMACIKKKELKIDFNQIDKSLAKIKWAGRLEKINKLSITKYKGLDVWVDVAHNELGFRILVNWLNKNNFKNLYIFLALGIKKDYINILKEVKKANPDLLYLISETDFQNHSPLKLDQFAKKIGIKSIMINSINNAFFSLKKINNKTNNKKTVIITGSIGLVGKFLSQIK